MPFQKLDDDLRFLMECFQEVLSEIGEKELANHLPLVGHGSLTPESCALFDERLLQAYSVAFQLLNMVEENFNNQERRTAEPQETGAVNMREYGLFKHQLTRLKELGLDARSIAQTMHTVAVEPVLTAHPTEAKRQTVLEQHRALYLLLLKRENTMFSSTEQQTIRNEIKANLERLWRTGEIYLEKPRVEDERRSILHYLREVFPSVLPRLRQQLRQAWEDVGFALNELDDLQGQPRFPALRFGSWVGGDRDGHPFVTPEVTQETLKEMRSSSLQVLSKLLVQLGAKMSFSARLQPPPQELVQAIKQGFESLRNHTLTPEIHELLERNNDEPWRQFVNLMLARLPVGKCDSEPFCYTCSAELHADLLLLRRSLVAVGAQKLALADIDDVVIAVRTFGFHLAWLDIRQNSQFHDQAMDELLEAADFLDPHFSAWNEEKRLAFLNKELQSKRPFTLADEPLGPKAQAVVGCYRVLAEALRKHGTGAGIGSLIVSMTHRLSDLLVVYLLAREAGLCVRGPESKNQVLACLLPVVPLFETISDLEKAPGILDDFLRHPVTVATLDRLAKEGDSTRQQQVMIGYSDSNKDAGIVASQVALHKGAAAITSVAAAHGAEIVFFHGRGGTISRGAGPTHRFMKALHPGTLLGRIRITEQGESIAKNYANLGTAAYHLELFLACTLRLALANRGSSGAKLSVPRPELFTELERCSEESAQHYQKLITAPGFVDFFAHATPIDALEQSRIGSRPARRTGERSLEDLRAIPWVFSWTQARFYLPGWYGVGSALSSFQQRNPAHFRAFAECLKNQSWPFLRYLILNIETNLLSASRELMIEYASLVADKEQRTRFLTDILAEFDLSKNMIDELFSHKKERRVRLKKSLHIREQALATLHREQIRLLRLWRQAQSHQKKGDVQTIRDDLLLSQLLMSINAIASGLGTTG